MHKFSTQLINFPRGYEVKPENLRLNDLRNAMTYYNATNFSQLYNELDIQHAWQLSQGNWKHLQHDLKLYFGYAPTQQNWVKRRALRQVMTEAKKF